MPLLACPAAKLLRPEGGRVAWSRGRLAGGLVLAGALAFSLPGATAAAATARGVTQEYDLKAAFLFNFAQFVDWPADAFADARTPITIGILGDDPFGPSLDEIVANESAHKRKLVVRRYQTVEQVEDCQILFIPASRASDVERDLTTLKGRSILTVGETKGFTTGAGVIGFELSQRRLRLRINLDAANAAKLTISSKLLRQAEIVGGGRDR